MANPHQLLTPEIRSLSIKGVEESDWSGLVWSASKVEQFFISGENFFVTVYGKAPIMEAAGAR
ncbi:hypothetical protein A3860_09940 [Niastella vici]|uniref:Uncharacterized protein n=1 Tax=Niastella vici TaxID=1703345 RepID=A0A1V9FEV7_9BACT|nr:hypothetical protein [Niastella vici]OQP56892.1 hypothetical protein A3860_09940 [Niastella vici]